MKYRSTVYLCVVCLAFCLRPDSGHAASADAIASKLMLALADPTVQAGSTTPNLALMSSDNHLEQLLVTTPEVIGGMREAILHAEHEVLLQIYEWNAADEATQSVMDALRHRVTRALEANEAPLSVRVIVSATYWAENDNSQTDLIDLISSVARHPRAQGRVALELAVWRASPLSILHSKVLVCDGQTALVMTGNLNTHGGPYRDSFNMAARITGPIVDVLRADWADARKGAMRHSTTTSGLSAELDWPRRAPASALSSTPALTAAVLTRNADWRPWGGSDQNPQDQGVVSLLDAASEHVCIINPSVGIQAVQDALWRAIIERQVSVYMVLSKEMNRERDRRFFGGDNVAHVHRLLGRLLEEGGACAADRLHVAWGAQDGVRTSPPNDPGNIHAKVASIDDNALLIGSANFNWLSWYNSRELSVALLGPQVADTFRQTVFRPLYHRAVPLRHTHLEVEDQTSTDAVYRYLLAKSPSPVP